MDHLLNLVERYPALAAARADIDAAFGILAGSFARGGKLMIAGNGGSAADAQHVVGELMKGFVMKRPVPDSLASSLERVDSGTAAYLVPRLQRGLPAIALSAHDALCTAVINDVSGDAIFAQQLYGYGREGDAFLGISTSGNSVNVLHAAALARAMDIRVVALTGGDGGKLRRLADACVAVPETETYRVQELHLPVYHCLCMMLEERFFP